ncbi:DNA repair exonuclease SbcCD nuclease subunit [Gracilibacillus orientalis]|uniref:DNA repair exonuclease SbcCD nuclease subunit n=1 Tax=Gracilibacillus orientalis TaxID=334253 RepID=A0A1I4HDW5_9BACI|nr:DNA repair exonuclease [Gracilibacillus orientalis]SFL40498.1 DNA repair exonuclease SbcCD nuclease subunit [Gracilibacillus orientalis]
MTRDISFIHCADLHLDSPFKGLKNIPTDLLTDIRNSTFLALDNLTEQAIQHQVDFVLLVGDIFDQEEQSMQAHMALRKAFQRLEEHQIKVYLSFGNHDYLNSQLFPRNYPDNVFVFDKEAVTSLPFIKNDQVQARIYGFSYENRAVFENKAKEYHKTDDHCFHIATLHGSIGNENIQEHAAYAPFQLTELKQAGFDYWALGHIHKREIVAENPPVVYPGNIQGRSTKETGEKGCYLVTLSENKSELEFLPLSSIIFKKIQVDASEWTDIISLTEQLTEVTNRITTGKTLIQLVFYQVAEEKEFWFTNGQLKEVIDYLNQESMHSYVIGYKWAKAAKRSEWQHGGHFLEELTTAFQETDLEKSLKPLWQHMGGRKWLSKLDEDDRIEIQQEAEYLLDQLLHEKEG